MSFQSDFLPEAVDLSFVLKDFFFGAGRPWPGGAPALGSVLIRRSIFLCFCEACTGFSLFLGRERRAGESSDTASDSAGAKCIKAITSLKSHQEKQTRPYSQGENVSRAPQHKKEPLSSSGGARPAL